MQQSHGQEEAQCWYLLWLHACAEHVDWTGSDCQIYMPVALSLPVPPTMQRVLLTLPHPSLIQWGLHLTCARCSLHSA